MLQCRPHIPFCHLWCTQEWSMQEQPAKFWHLQQRDLSNITYQYPNLNYTKALPFSTPPYQLSLDVSDKLKNLHPLSFNSSNQWTQRKHLGAGDDARLEPTSTRNRDAFGKRQFTILYSTAATYSCLHPSPLLHPLMCEHKKSASELATDWRGGWRELTLEFCISSSAKETHSGNNRKSTGLLSKTDL